jgi:hypothetical protein
MVGRKKCLASAQMFKNLNKKKKIKKKKKNKGKK